MNPERLAAIRAAYALWDSAGTAHGGDYVADMVPELLEYVDELTRSRDDARRMVVDAGVFQTHEGTEYLPDPRPVAWDVQTEQPL